MKKALKVLVFLLLAVVILAAGGVTYLKLAKPNVGKAPDLKIAATPERVERGRYIANHVAVCIDCHSTRDWTRFSGPVVEGTFGKGGEKFGPELGFPGSFYSRNITPAGIKDWTDGEIFRAVTCGVSKDGGPLFPLMPYHYYGAADTEDIYSVIAYIRTLAPIVNTPPESKPDFPFSLIMRTIPAKGVPGHRPAPNDSIAYGSYLVNLAACVECHTKVDDKAQLIKGTEFGGGREFALTGSVVHSANISPDATGIGMWSREQFIDRFKQYLKPENVVGGLKPTDNNSIMPWTMYAGMSEADLSCIYQYLKTVRPIENTVVKYTPKLTAAR